MFSISELLETRLILDLFASFDWLLEEEDLLVLWSFPKLISLISRVVWSVVACCVAGGEDTPVLDVDMGGGNRFSNGPINSGTDDFDISVLETKRAGVFGRTLNGDLISILDSLWYECKEGEVEADEHVQTRA